MIFGRDHWNISGMREGARRRGGFFAADRIWLRQRVGGWRRV